MSYIKVYVHFVWSTKNREPFLTKDIRYDVFNHIKENAKKKNIYLPLNTIEQNNCSLLDTINGCDEWYINDTENIIIIKYDEELTTKEEIKKILQKTQTKG